MFVTILCQFACWEYCFKSYYMRVKIATFFWDGTKSQTLKIYLEQTSLVRLQPHFARTVLNIFIIIDQCRFFTFRIGLDILNNVLEDVFVWAAWVLFSFYLKQKQRSKTGQSGTLLKMPTSSPSVEEFCRGIQK